MSRAVDGILRGAVAPLPVRSWRRSDPRRRQADAGGRLVVVVERLGHVQQLARRHAEVGHPRQEGGEVGRVRLVGADVLAP